MRRLSLLAVILLLALPGAAAGQDALQFSSFVVSLWPEYDRRAMLVIYQAELAPEVPLPAQVNLSIPAEVGTPHAVAVAEENGNLINAPFETSEQGAWTILTVQAQSRRVWIEYYDEITFDGEAREFSYRWPGTHLVQSFAYEVLRPPGVEGMAISPVPTGQRTDSRDLIYQTGSLGPVPAGEAVTLELSYRRSTEQLTVDAVGASTGPADATSPVSSSVLWWPFAAAGALLLSLMGGYLFWWRPRHREESPRKRKPAERPERARGARFCHACGLEVQPGDRFCRRCGAEVRTSR